MQKELDNCRPLFHQHFFELADVAEPPLRVFLFQTSVYTRHQHILIMRAVEGSDVAFRRGLHMHSPQEIVSLLLQRGLFEARNDKSLRVNP
ncbi:hypothetical protein D3C81_2015360 [compost metagenome]